MISTDLFVALSLFLTIQHSKSSHRLVKLLYANSTERMKVVPVIQLFLLKTRIRFILGDRKGSAASLIWKSGESIPSK